MRNESNIRKNVWFSKMLLSQTLKCQLNNVVMGMQNKKEMELAKNEVSTVKRGGGGEGRIPLTRIINN